MSEATKAFYKTKAWKKCREAYIAERVNIDGGLCEICGRRAGYIVHHINEVTPKNMSDPMVTLNSDNLIWVCHECHNDLHLHGGVDLFDSQGNFNGTIKHKRTNL